MTDDLANEIRRCAMGGISLGSDWHFYLFPLKLPKTKAVGTGLD